MYLQITCVSTILHVSLTNYYFTYEMKNSNLNSTTTQQKLSTHTTDRILINEGQNISMHSKGIVHIHSLLFCHPNGRH